jgi:hypothetical protein
VEVLAAVQSTTFAAPLVQVAAAVQAATAAALAVAAAVRVAGSAALPVAAALATSPSASQATSAAKTLQEGVRYRDLREFLECEYGTEKPGKHPSAGVQFRRFLLPSMPLSFREFPFSATR